MRFGKKTRSRDHRSERTQILLAIATDTHGTPLHISILRCNRADSSKLRSTVKILRRRFQIPDAVFVFDGGMSSKINLQSLEVEEAFCELKSYLQVRPVFHRTPERVINHVRTCFLAYWISPRLARQWCLCGETGEVTRIMRQLQTIRLGSLHIKIKDSKSSKASPKSPQTSTPNSPNSNSSTSSLPRPPGPKTPSPYSRSPKKIAPPVFIGLSGREKGKSG